MAMVTHPTTRRPHGLADDETIRWQGTSSFARTAAWRLPGLLLGLVLVSVGADLWPLGTGIDWVIDGAIERVFGVPVLPAGDSDGLLVGVLDLALCFAGLWYIWDFINVLEDNGRTTHIVTDRRILQVSGGSKRSTPFSALTGVSSDIGRWGGGLEITAAGSKKPLRISGIADADEALKAVVAGMGRD
jgi:hypothetical protein